MKIALTALAFTGYATAYAPNMAFARRSKLGMSAVETPTYTFAKSEEIFKEAQEVRSAVF